MTDGWARSGAMWLTGRPDGPPPAVTGDPAGSVNRALARLRDVAPEPDRLPDVRLLGERAARMRLVRAGERTAGGAGRLLPAADGWLAMSLARPSDFELIPALTSSPAGADPWIPVRDWAAVQPAKQAEERARMLGLPVAAVTRTLPPPSRPGVVIMSGGGARRRTGPPRVLDLSSLWAGPLCSHLLALMGADVVKLESTRRPDGARKGDPGFYDLLHAGHRSVALDLTTDEGRALLARLVARADLVLEASRPRALRQLGIDAETAIAAGTSWVSITAGGRDGDAAMRVGFGDDIAAGAGLLAWDEKGPMFAGDALADPLTGVVAAAAVAERRDEQDAALIDVSMHDLACEAATRVTTMSYAPVEHPWCRPVTGRAPSLGQHTRDVLDEW